MTQSRLIKDLFGDVITPMERTPKEIITEAIERYSPIRSILMVSGGYDSVTSAHQSAIILKELGMPFTVYHGDTTIGIPATQQYVKDVCKQYGWNLEIRKPPKRKEWYDETVKKFGFPGPTKQMHRITYRRLKERALNYFVTHELKSKPHARENVLLITGVRNDESVIRMGYVNTVTKQKSKIWVNAIFYWTEAKVLQYRRDNDIPKNWVKELLCISGECLCGAFTCEKEYQDIKKFFPDVAKQLDDLYEVAKANGKNWKWWENPTKKRGGKKLNHGVPDMFMCVGCEARR